MSAYLPSAPGGTTPSPYSGAHRRSLASHLRQLACTQLPSFSAGAAADAAVAAPPLFLATLLHAWLCKGAGRDPPRATHSLCPPPPPTPPPPLCRGRRAVCAGPDPHQPWPGRAAVPAGVAAGHPERGKAAGWMWMHTERASTPGHGTHALLRQSAAMHARPWAPGCSPLCAPQLLKHHQHWFTQLRACLPLSSPVSLPSGAWSIAALEALVQNKVSHANSKKVSHAASLP